MKKIKKLFLLVACMFGLSGISPVLVPFSIGEDHNLNAIVYATGVMFWLGLLLGIAGYIGLILILQKKKENVLKEKSKTFEM